jgi:hypothetical protein
VIGLERAPDRRASWEYDERIYRAEGRAARLLASCLRVERDGRRVPGPAAPDEDVRQWLDGVEGNEAQLQLDLGGLFGLAQPGTYRVRLSLPGAGQPSLSNILEVRVFAAPAQGEEE